MYPLEHKNDSSTYPPKHDDHNPTYPPEHDDDSPTYPLKHDDDNPVYSPNMRMIVLHILLKKMMIVLHILLNESMMIVLHIFWTIIRCEGSYFFRVARLSQRSASLVCMLSSLHMPSRKLMLIPKLLAISPTLPRFLLFHEGTYLL